VTGVGPEAVLSFWFGDLDEDGVPQPEIVERWFRPPAGFDEEVSAHFGDVIADAIAGRLDGWAAAPRGRLALILLLDQLTRNVYRGSARAFAGDAAAVALTLGALDAGEDRALRPIERSFLCLSLMHAEDLPHQDRCVAVFAALLGEAPPPLRAQIARSHEFAISHRETIRRFGRFPSRNAILGRATTPEEAAFLAENPAGF